jgi:hypothetical protein
LPTERARKKQSWPLPENYWSVVGACSREESRGEEDFEEPVGSPRVAS